MYLMYLVYLVYLMYLMYLMYLVYLTYLMYLHPFWTIFYLHILLLVSSHQANKTWTESLSFRQNMSTSEDSFKTASIEYSLKITNEFRYLFKLLVSLLHIFWKTMYSATISTFLKLFHTFLWKQRQQRASTKRVLNLNFLNYLLIVPMYHGDVSRVIPLQNLESWVLKQGYHALVPLSCM